MRWEGCSIVDVRGREMLDSRGNPTVEATVQLENGVEASGMAPSGASTGMYEALELRDRDQDRYLGQGVLKAVDNVNLKIRPAIQGQNVLDLAAIDDLMCRLDGTPDKSQLGANAILAVSLACGKAGAKSLGMPFYRYIGGLAATSLPLPMMNVLNGGVHASNNVDIQEFMIVPVGMPDFREGLRWCSEVTHALASLLKGRGLSTSVGDEGGFAPNLRSDEDGLELILQAITLAGFQAPRDFQCALDVAASAWAVEEGYLTPKHNIRYTTGNLISYWADLCDRYPILSLEDPLGENDWQGWQRLTREIGGRVQLVGDDLFVTNPQRLARGLEEGCGNAILIKPNQIGTISETIRTVQMAHRAGFTTILSHRSGETEDTSIADLAVGLQSKYIKAGAPCRGERIAKYNRVLHIQELLGV